MRDITCVFVSISYLWIAWIIKLRNYIAKKWYCDCLLKVGVEHSCKKSQWLQKLQKKKTFSLVYYNFFFTWMRDSQYYFSYNLGTGKSMGDFGYVNEKKAMQIDSYFHPDIGYLWHFIF